MAYFVCPPKRLALGVFIFALITVMLMLQSKHLRSFSVCGLLSIAFTCNASHTLRFSPGGTFHLAVFEDLHFGEAEDLDWGPEQDVRSNAVMNTILQSEPSIQLVVLNGDLITGENTYMENSTSYVDKIVRPMLEHDLPWASTYGNHDSDFNISREGIFTREKQWPNSLTKWMVSDSDAGVTNYYLPIFSSDTKDPTPAALLWFFDSRGGNYYQTLHSDGNRVPQPNWIDESVVSWFRQTNDELMASYGKTVPSIAFYQ